MLRRFLSLALCALGVAAVTAAPPAEPPSPPVWNVELRYLINAFRAERLLQYTEMVADLKAAGFVRDPDEVVPNDEPENSRYSSMRGRVPANGVPRLLRQRHVRSLLLSPVGAKLDKGNRVRINVSLSSGYTPAAQKLLASQTAAVLTKDAGFIEAIGYDPRGYTRLVGSVPIENLDRLLRDVRTLPSGASQPGPFRNLSPVRATYARPDWPVPAVRPALPVVPPGQEKFSPDLRALLGDAAAAGNPTRLEVILGYTPTGPDRAWQKTLALPGVAVEGRLGPLVTVSAVPRDVADNLAANPDVVAVRMPRQAAHASPGRGGKVPAKWEPVRASGLARLHAMGHQGRGTRIAIIADDFQGWETLKKLAPQTVLIDLTAERRRDLLPDVFPAAKGELGYGTQCAIALQKAAPQAELTLVRIDAAAPYMLETVARFINGESVRTVAIEARYAEMQRDQASLDARRGELEEERRVALDDFRNAPESIQRQKEYLAKQAAFDAEARDLRDRQRRYLKLTEALRRLKGVQVVASSLVWTEGYPVDGSSALSRYFDDRPFRAALWFQAAGDTAGQAWTGLFRDVDANGVMEFSDANAPLPRGTWTRELNFLAWRSDGKSVRDLPADARIRLTLQWREAHDPLPLRMGEDPYREPLAKLRLVVVYQPDPDGKTRPADDLQVMAQTAGSPQRLNQTLNAATYEHLLVFQTPRAGRYGVFIEGAPPESTHAPGEAHLPNTKRLGELHVRLFANTLSGPGQAIWSEFATKSAALGMPADAHRVIAVGAADAENHIRPSSASGSPFQMSLLHKPDVYAYDDGGGTAQAASFAAGLAASSWGSRGTLFGLLEAMRVHPGDVLRVPTALPPPGR